MGNTGSFVLPEKAAPKIRALFDYWRSIHPDPAHPGAGLPGRQHFDPMDIPQLLPNIWMMDVEREPLRFRLRLVGTEIVKFSGRDATGQWLDEIFTDYEKTDAYRFHRACALSGEPGYRKGSVLSNPERDYIEAERLYLPLAEDGKTVDILLVITLYDGTPPPPRR
mgnify:FL=1